MDKKVIRAIKNDPAGYVATLSKTKLFALLKELDLHYHTDANPPISDEEYDILRDVYEDRFGTYGEIGAPVRGETVKLPVPMGSLSKIKPGSSVLKKFLESHDVFVVSDKEDGISLEIVYDGGVPVKAYTRGEDGINGKDVSRVLRYLDIPKKIPEDGIFIPRVEVTIDRATFESKYAKAGDPSVNKGKGFATGRNFAGSLLNRNAAHSHIKSLKPVAFEIMKGRGAGQKVSTQFKLLAKFGFHVVPYKVFTELSETKLVRYHNARKNPEAARDIDGIVVTADVPYKIKQGNPTHSYAFKINSIENSVVVPVKDVVWAESRYGRLIPRVEIEPTKVGGVTVTYFTGHNSFFIEHGYGADLASKPPHEPRPINKGAHIRVVRSGDVIPYIMEVVKPARYPSEPAQPHIEKGVDLYAVHDGVSDVRKVKELEHFFVTVGVDGLKSATISKLVDAGFDTVKKILGVTLQDLLNIPGFQRKSAAQLVANLKKADMSFVLVAKGSGKLGMGIGERRLNEIYENIPDILTRGNLDKETLASEIRKLKGFDKLADQIAGNLERFVKFCRRNGIKLKAPKRVDVTGDVMAGKVILFTSVRDNQLQDWIVQNGGKLATTVKQATMLIVKDSSASNAKTEQAIENNIPIVTLAEFRRKYKVPQ